ncbi:SH3 domain-containing protein [Streptomyces sp. NPDC096310]|uniref:SH3 domain-containing protein n=1 Tax=Streptomyces sp. NPDC096310 TaxID=3366082 RepID=UPI0037F46B03
MPSNRIAVSVALLGALALPALAATTAMAAPASAPNSASAAGPCDRPGPWVIGTQAVNIRSKASATSTSVGILYRGHKFTVHKTSGNWHYITDNTTGVKGWVSGTYVFRSVHMCLD